MLNLSSFIQVFKLFLPALIANGSPVLLKEGYPIDFRKKFIDGRRILGDGKTFEGFALGMFFGFYIGIVEAIVFQNILYIKTGFLSSLGALLGDIAGSFIKRRIGLKRGERAPLLDQLDFIYGAAILLVIAKVEFDLLSFLIFQIVVIILHVLTNRIAYYLKLKPVPW